MIVNASKIGGRLTRIEVVRNGTSLVHRINLHNTITDAGMQFIFKGYAGQGGNNTVALNGTYINYTGGCYYMQVGTGSTPTNVSMNALENKITETNIRYCDGATGITKGSRCYVNDGTFFQEQLRTHQFTATSDFVLSEVGYFGNLTGLANDRTMFARIVLEDSLSVKKGDVVRITYNLRVSADARITSGIIGEYNYQKRISCFNPNYDKWIYSSTCHDMIDICTATDRYTMSDNYYAASAKFNLNMGDYIYAVIRWSGTPVSFASDSSGRPDTFDLSALVDHVNNGHLLQTMGSWEIGQNYRDATIIFDESYTGSFYNIRYRGWDFRFGYYDTDGTTWIDQPIVKDANHRLKFTFRTTIERD